MKKIITGLVLLAFIAIIFYMRLQPLRELKTIRSYTGAYSFSNKPLAYDKTKKTVVIMADNNMTEMFDLLAPFYLFSKTGKANVYIAAQKKYPVVMKKGPFVIPHFSYKEMDSLHIKPDVIVIPFMDDAESNIKTSWIKKHYTDSVVILSICDGALTAAATGIYDGTPLTSHATGHEKLKAKFSKPLWVQQVSVTQSGNLFSTAGVSNAVDGSLAVIKKIFGQETMLQVMKAVHYPHDSLHTSHHSVALNTSNKITALVKMVFKTNKRLGVVLQNNVEELQMAAVYDTYNRTLPQTVQTIITDGNSITTRHGLTILSTDQINAKDMDEIHYLAKNEITQAQRMYKNAKIISYEKHQENYIFNTCFWQIKKDCGPTFQQFVKLTLDYN